MGCHVLAVVRRIFRATLLRVAFRTGSLRTAEVLALAIQLRKLAIDRGPTSAVLMAVSLEPAGCGNLRGPISAMLEPARPFERSQFDGLMVLQVSATLPTAWEQTK